MPARGELGAIPPAVSPCASDDAVANPHGLLPIEAASSTGSPDDGRTQIGGLTMPWIKDTKAQAMQAEAKRALEEGRTVFVCRVNTPMTHHTMSGSMPGFAEQDRGGRVFSAGDLNMPASLRTPRTGRRATSCSGPRRRRRSLIAERTGKVARRLTRSFATNRLRRSTLERRAVSEGGSDGGRLQSPGAGRTRGA